MAVRNCDDSVFFIIIEQTKTKQLQIITLKTDYNNKTRYSCDINNIQRSWKITKIQNIKPGDIYKWQ